MTDAARAGRDPSYDPFGGRFQLSRSRLEAGNSPSV